MSDGLARFAQRIRPLIPKNITHDENEDELPRLLLFCRLNVVI